MRRACPRGARRRRSAERGGVLENDPEQHARLPDLAEVPDPELVARVQQQLKNIRLFQVDSGDGSMTPKGRTEGAILDFRNREGLPLAPTIDDEFLTRLAKAQPIDVAEHRAYATLEAAAIEHLVGFLALGLAPLILLSVSSFSAILCALLVRLPLAGGLLENRPRNWGTRGRGPHQRPHGFPRI